MCHFFEKEIHHITRKTSLVKSCNKETNYQFLMLDWSYISGRSLINLRAKHGVRWGLERGWLYFPVYKTPSPRMQQIHKRRFSWGDSRVPKKCFIILVVTLGILGGGSSSKVYWVYLSSMFPAYQVDLEIGCASMKMPLAQFVHFINMAVWVLEVTCCYKSLYF